MAQQPMDSYNWDRLWEQSQETGEAPFNENADDRTIRLWNSEVRNRGGDPNLIIGEDLFGYNSEDGDGDQSSGSGGGYGSGGGLGGGYGGGYQSSIDTLLDQILNGDPFSYDYNSDPLFAALQESYTREGGRAMQDTIGQLSARTGGLAGSYAGSVGQQAYNNFMEQLNDKIPQLEQYAYGKYRDDRSDLYNQMGMLQSLDNTAYGRYRDTVGDARYNQEYADMMDQQQWENDFMSQQYADNLEQKALENGWYEDEQSFGRAATLLQMGFSNQEIADALGIPLEQVEAYAYKVNNPVRSSGGSGYGGGGSTGAHQQSWSSLDSAMDEMWDMYGGEDGRLSPVGKNAMYNYAMTYGGEYAQQLLIKWGLEGYKPSYVTGSTTPSGSGNAADPALEQTLGDFNTVQTTVENMINSGKSYSQVVAYLQGLLSQGYITENEFYAILSGIGSA